MDKARICFVLSDGIGSFDPGLLSAFALDGYVRKFGSTGFNVVTGAKSDAKIGMCSVLNI